MCRTAFMDELFSIVFFGGLVLCILFGPWILLWRSRARQRREREEDQQQVHRLTQRLYLLEEVVRKLRPPVDEPKPAPPRPEKKVAAPPPVLVRETAAPSGPEPEHTEGFVARTPPAIADTRPPETVPTESD